MESVQTAAAETDWLQSLLAPAATCVIQSRFCVSEGLKIALVLTRLFWWCQTETSPPAFVSAPVLPSRPLAKGWDVSGLRSLHY